jgi:predicted RNA-binding protein with PIN domain
MIDVLNFSLYHQSSTFKKYKAHFFVFYTNNSKSSNNFIEKRTVKNGSFSVFSHLLSVDGEVFTKNNYKKKCFETIY